MTRLLLPALLAGCAAVQQPQYTEDGRRVCRANEPLHSGCVIEIQANCSGAPITPDQQAKACR